MNKQNHHCTENLSTATQLHLQVKDVRGIELITIGNEEFPTMKETKKETDTTGRPNKDIRNAEGSLDR